jgi:hypothetical protein
MIQLVTALMLFAAFTVTHAGSGSAQPGGDQGSPIPGLPGFRVDQKLNAAGKVEGLLVYQGQQLVETLDLCTAEPLARVPPLGNVAAADFNFDGFPDLALEVTDAKDNNNTFCVWLFEPQSRRFKFSSDLSELVNPAPDPKTRTVVSRKDGPCPYCYEKREFRWSAGQLTLVRSESLTLDPRTSGTGECEYVLTVKKLKDGVVREIGRERATAFGNPCPDDFWLERSFDR